MDRIEPVSPSQRAIAPIDPTHVKVRGSEREQSDSEQREAEARRRQAEEERRASEHDPDGEDDEPRHIDVRV
jgi:hypothetical protein